MANAAILLAAGRGSRMQGEVDDKILHELNGEPIVKHSFKAFIGSNIIDQYYIVYRDEAQRQELESICESLNFKADFIQGGPERQDSVYNALTRLPEDAEFVFIHDCARPLVNPSDLPKLLVLTKEHDAASLAKKVTDTIKQTEKNEDEEDESFKLKHLDRETLWAMETPQVFKTELIRNCYQQVITNKIRITDDTSAVSEYGHKVAILASESPNPKITSPEDIKYVEFLLKRR